MSRELSQQRKRLFSEQEFRSADRLDRIFMSIRQHELTLDDEEMAYYKQLLSVFSIMTEYTNESDAVDMIRGVYFGNIRELEVWSLMNDAKRLFGNVIERRKEFDRLVIRTQLLDNHKLAKDAGDIGESRRCLVAVSKMDALDKHDKVREIDPDDIKPRPIVFTSDPRALQVEDAEVIKDDEEE